METMEKIWLLWITINYSVIHRLWQQLICGRLMSGLEFLVNPARILN